MSRTQCNFASFLTGAAPDRTYRVVAVQTARWVLKRRSKFDTSDVKFAHSMSKLNPMYAHRLVEEFLASWETPGHDGHSRLATQIVTACPALHSKVLKYWRGT